MYNTKSKTLAIIGLDAYGLNLVRLLSSSNFYLRVADKRMERIESVRDLVDKGICFDPSNIEVLGVTKFLDTDMAVLTLEDFKLTEMIVLEFQRAGIEPNYTMVRSGYEETILQQLGIHHVAYPEKWAAKVLSNM